MTSTYRIDLQQRRSLRAIFTAAFSLYRRYPLLFPLLALPIVATYDLALLAITGYGPLVRLGRHSQILFWSNTLLRTALVSPLISALHVHAVETAGEGRIPRLRPVARRGVAVLPLVTATSLVTGVGITVGLVALVVPGVLLLLRWAVASQVAAIERQGPLAAIRSSSRLTNGRRLHVLGLVLSVGLVAFATDELARALPLGSSSGVVEAVVGIAVQTLIASVGALTLALLYFDLRGPAQVGPHNPMRQQRKPRPARRRSMLTKIKYARKRRRL
jgi:hypothetical protein